MLCLHRALGPRNSSSFCTPFHHPHGTLIPFRVSLKKSEQFPAMDLQCPMFSCPSASPKRRHACHAVCFKEEVSSLAFKDQPAFVASETSISCTTFNILAPIYKRINGEGFRESAFRESWLSRNRRILDLLLLSNSSILCLQEFWLGNEELTNLYDENLTKAEYLIYKLGRTNGRGDGLLTAIKSSRLSVLKYKELLFNDCGDRVAQFFHLCLKTPTFDRRDRTGTELLLVNTHLLFPHDLNYCLVRLRQVYKMLKFIHQYKVEHDLTSIPVILCGDWNGSKRGRVYKFLRSQGYLSSYDAAHDYVDEDIQRWISHKNHLGNICEVDFIWLLNPCTNQKSMLASWHEAVLGTIKAKLSQIGLKGKDAFHFFVPESNRNFVTLQEFEQGLRKLELTECCTGECSEGLTEMEIQQLMQFVDLDRNGVIDFDEFEALLTAEGSDPVSPSDAVRIPNLYCDSLNSTGNKVVPTAEMDMAKVNKSAACDMRRQHSFNVKEAFLFPPEVEAGIWPEEYSLSDHAALTVRFTLPRTSLEEGGFYRR